MFDPALPHGLAVAALLAPVLHQHLFYCLASIYLYFLIICLIISLQSRISLIQVTLPYAIIQNPHMNQNTAQAKPSRTYKSKITLPRQSLNTQKQRTKHQTHGHIHFWLNGKHRRSQSSHHMKLPSFYHTIVHDNDSVNEMLQVCT